MYYPQKKSEPLVCGIFSLAESTRKNEGGEAETYGSGNKSSEPENSSKSKSTLLHSNALQRFARNTLSPMMLQDNPLHPQAQNRRDSLVKRPGNRVNK